MRMRDQGKMALEIVNFLRLYGRFNWGRQILGQAFRRFFEGETFGKLLVKVAD